MRRISGSSISTLPILEFEYREQVLALRALKREREIKKAEMGASFEGRVSRNDDSAWELARLEEFRVTKQIADLEQLVDRFRIAKIDGETEPEAAQLGTMVVLHDQSQAIDNPFLLARTGGEGRISVDAPLARLLIGKQPYERIEFTTSESSTQYVILAVRWGVKEYLRDYLTKYLQKEMLCFEQAVSAHLLDEHGSILLTHDSGKQERVDILKGRATITGMAERLDYALLTANEHGLVIPDAARCETAFDGVAELLRKAGSPYTSPCRAAG